MSSKRQTCVSHSTPEAELVAMDTTLRVVAIPIKIMWDTLAPARLRCTETKMRCSKSLRQDAIHQCVICLAHIVFRYRGFMRFINHVCLSSSTRNRLRWPLIPLRKGFLIPRNGMLRLRASRSLPLPISSYPHFVRNCASWLVDPKATLAEHPNWIRSNCKVVASWRLKLPWVLLCRVGVSLPQPRYRQSSGLFLIRYLSTHKSVFR